MKYLKKFAVILCAAVLLLCMTSCAGAGSSIRVPKGHVPTISENIDTLRKSGYRYPAPALLQCKKRSGNRHRIHGRTLWRVGQCGQGGKNYTDLPVARDDGNVEPEHSVPGRKCY